MTSRTVVILTEPEQCELADADTLVQAVLQIQELNKAGLGGSQAFCDHPAAAMQFIEAYARAYPELQLRSSDLPPPEQLYSLVADGRVMPLRGAAAPDIAKTGEAGQLYPLYVLSLGAPDALMQALQHNRFAKNDIQVVEIAPIESSGSEPVSVAEAVAHEPLSGSSWGVEGSAELGHNGEILPLEELSSSGPIKLASVEVNLDHIQVDRSHDQKDPYNPVLDEPATVVTPPAAGPVGAAGGGPQPSADGTGVIGSTAAVNPAPQSAPDAAPQSAPLSAAPLVASPPVAMAAPPVEEDMPEAVIGADAPEDAAAAESDGTSPESLDATAKPSDEGDEERSKEAAADADAPGDSVALADGAATGASAAVPSTAMTSAAITAASDAERGRIDAGSFSAPGEDVRYPPNGSFAMNDDVTYAEPAASGSGLLEAFFGGSGESEVVDLEAVLAGLSDTAGAFAAPVDGFELERARGGAAAPEVAVSELPYPDEPTADHEDAEDQRSPAVHDLDI